MDDIRKSITVKEMENSYSLEKLAEKQVGREDGPKERFITQSYLEVQKRNQQFERELALQEAYDQQHSASAKGMGAIYDTVLSARNVLNLPREDKAIQRPGIEIKPVFEGLDRKEAFVEEAKQRGKERSRSFTPEKSPIKKDSSPIKMPIEEAIIEVTVLTKEEILEQRKKKIEEAKERFKARKSN